MLELFTELKRDQEHDRLLFLSGSVFVIYLGKKNCWLTKLFSGRTRLSEGQASVTTG